MAAASLTVDPIPDELIRSWVAPLRDAGVRRDLVKFCARDRPALHARRRRAAAHASSGPCSSLGERATSSSPWTMPSAFGSLFPNARVEKIENARTFVPLDAPERLAELIGAVASEPAAV